MSMLCAPLLSCRRHHPPVADHAIVQIPLLASTFVGQWKMDNEDHRNETVPYMWHSCAFSIMGQHGQDARGVSSSVQAPRRLVDHEHAGLT